MATKNTSAKKQREQKSKQQQALVAQEAATNAMTMQKDFAKIIDSISGQFAVIHKILSDMKKAGDARYGKDEQAVFKRFGDLLNESTKLEKGSTPEQLRQWLTQYALVQKSMASQLPWLKDQAPLSNSAKEAAAAESDRRKNVSAFTNSLDKLLKDHKDTEKKAGKYDEAAENRDELGFNKTLLETQKTGFMVGMAGLLGPGAPLLHLVKSMVDTDALAKKAQEKSWGLLKSIGRGVASVFMVEKEYAEQAHKDNADELEFQKAEAKAKSLDELEKERELESEKDSGSSNNQEKEKHVGKGFGSSFLASLGLAGGKLLDMIGFGKKGVLSKVGKYLVDFSEEFAKKGFSLVADLGKTIFSGGWKIIKSVAGTLVGGAWGLIKNVGARLVGLLSDGLMSVAETIAKGVGFLLASPEILVGGAIVAAVAAIGYFGWKYRKQIMEFATNVWDKLKEGVTAAWDGIKTGVNAAWKEVEKLFPNASAEIASFASSTWTGIKDGVTAAASKVESWAKEGWGVVKKSPIGEITDFYSKIYDWMWDKIKGIASSAWDTVKGWWGDAKNKVAPVIQKVENAADAIKKKVAPVASKVITEGEKVASYVASSGGTVVGGAIQSAGSAVHSAGVATQSPTVASAGSKIEGFGQRVTDTSQSMGSTAAGAVGSYGKKAMSAVGIKMPDKTVGQVLLDAARTVGIDPGILFATAQAESNFNPDAKARTSSAGGLFQFINSTWEGMVRKYGKQYGITMQDKMNPRANAIMGALFERDNQRYLASHGVPPNAGNTYMAHFMGAGSAVKFISAMYQDPNADAAKEFPEQARANKPIFFNNGKPRTMREVYELMTTNNSKVSTAKVAAYDTALGVTSSGVQSPEGITAVASAAPTQKQSPTTQLAPKGPVQTATATEKTAPVVASGAPVPAATVASEVKSTTVASTKTPNGAVALATFAKSPIDVQRGSIYNQTDPAHTAVASASTIKSPAAMPTEAKVPASAPIIVAKATPPKMRRAATKPIAEKPVEVQVAQNSNPQKTVNNGGSLAIHLVPSFISDEGLLVINTPGVA